MFIYSAQQRLQFRNIASQHNTSAMLSMHPQEKSMSTPSEQFTEITQSQLNPPITMINGLAGKTFARLEKIIALNIATSKVSIQESNNAFRKLLGTTDPQEFLSITITQLESNLQRMRSYSQNLLELVEKTAIEPVQNTEKTLVSNTEAAAAEAQPPAIVATSHAAAPAADEPIEHQKI
ncbi:MAG: phasin family protein, partial [Oxalobacteraceae bacterium]